MFIDLGSQFYALLQFGKRQAESFTVHYVVIDVFIVEPIILRIRYRCLSIGVIT